MVILDPAMDHPPMTTTMPKVGVPAKVPASQQDRRYRPMIWAHRNRMGMDHRNDQVGNRAGNRVENHRIAFDDEPKARRPRKRRPGPKSFFPVVCTGTKEWVQRQP